MWELGLGWLNFEERRISVVELIVLCAVCCEELIVLIVLCAVRCVL
jgi:hypothetical protein